MSLPKVNIYTYTAQANPYFARSLAHKFGYEFDKDQPLSSVLQQLVSYEGEPALNEIIENNPDKDLFMDYFKKKFQNEEEKVDKGSYEQNLMLQQYMNFSGQQLQSAQQIAENKSLTNQTALMVIIGAAVGFFALSMVTPIYSVMDNI